MNNDSTNERKNKLLNPIRDQETFAVSKNYVLDKKQIDKRFYFQSLVDTASLMGLIEDEMLDHIQVNLIALLGFKVDQFTQGKSSSVRMEIAEMLMKSNLFTISHYLKSLDSPDEALHIIKTTPLKEVYELGLNCINESIKKAKKLHKIILSTLYHTPNETYNETVVEGIKVFFKLYDPSFEAHSIHITADYPTIKPIEKLDGIEFILAFLQSIYHENKFCNSFNTGDTHLYLKGLHAHYDLLIINLFEPLLTGAIACHILGLEVNKLLLNPFQIERLYTELHTLSKHALYHKFKESTIALLDQLRFDHASSKRYIIGVLPVIVSRVYLALKMDTLEQVIYIKAAPTKDKELLYHAAPKMNDELFRIVLEELSECRYASDRVALILKEVKSLEDLEDFVEEASLSKSEIKAILSKLPLIEIAVLIERHPLTVQISVTDRTTQELLLSQCLEEHKNKLSVSMQHALKRLSYHLSK